MTFPSDPPDSPGGRRLWRNVVALGLVSLLTDVSSEMIVPLLPVFLTTVLGAGPLLLGWMEGLADAVASLLKLATGRWADRTRRNRPFVVVGYTLASVARPLVALATAPWHVVAIRMADRTGKGLRTSPRDSMIAASVPPNEHGSAFGLHRAMDHAGAALGPLLAVAVLTWWSTDLRVLFALAAIPAALAVIVVLSAVREATEAPATTQAPADEVAPPAKGSLARFLLPFALFTLGNASDVFLLLKAGAVRAPLQSLPLLWMGLNVVKLATALLGGRLADRWGRRRTVASGWLVFIVCYVGFAFAETQLAVVLLFLFYGAHHGLSEAAEKSLVASLVPAQARGSGFGWYHLVSGLIALAASVLFGGLWQAFGSRTAFLTSACLAAVAVALLPLLSRRPDVSAGPAR